MRDWDYENEQWTKLPTYLKHLPLFTRHIDLFSVCMRFLWSIFLKNIAFKYYIRLQVKGTPFKELYKTQPKLIIISNHASHLDATSIAAAIPRRYWLSVYIAAAKDYFFSNPLFTFFSQHCLGAIPIDRKDRKGEAVNLILKLLTEQPRMWLIIFPEGTRSQTGKVQEFKRGISIFSEKTQTPILFTYLEGNLDLWPKGQFFAKPGKLVLHVGPVHPPAPIQQVYTAYKSWVLTINPDAFPVTEETAAPEKTEPTTLEKVE
ncbi:lysophospholipid acyltransferase family protein [Bdellovibrio svalbardensis]|uniref:1-acyl-sn-glycerol-3-phosphate acyltransferase n=1 Tax=Bdellovibrio svalbardensis TaxID=2972972 RepID=A0ABT6DMH6_9BACT|nr:lysophospholipid acyltransferase family protein [Bdellovibrio svalbardensis]MDG0818077.1 1-acyl-sn-glycerol-3-phosphate acyltransferase [Bdellovibrio svalbardensis]